MSEPGPIISIAIKALLSERTRVLGKLDGAFKRLQFAQSQVASETALTTEYLNDIATLEEAIRVLGGDIPPSEDVPPTPEEPVPSGAEPEIVPFVEDAPITPDTTSAFTPTADIPPETPPPAPVPDLEPPPPDEPPA